MSDSPDTLARRLREAREAYYNSEAPILSDAEFDALEDELRAIDPAHEYFSSVGIEGGLSDGEKISHRVPMLSMGKAKTLEEVSKWLDRLKLAPDTALTVQPKIDGLSASAFYQGGKLRYITTRGDGIVGQDVSHIAPYIGDFPSQIAFTDKAVEIRGELHLPRDTDYDTGGRPLRNNCVGLINRKDDRENLKFVRFLAYQIVWPDSGHLSSGATAADPESLESEPRLASESGKIELLGDNGFYTFQSRRLVAETPDAADLVRQIGDIFTEYVDGLRDSWNFETDGLIILVDDNRLHDEIDERWVVDHHHHYALAFKPPAQAEITTLKSVVWQVSRQGNLSPVAVFEPVTIGGATLERASLHNAENVRRLRLTRGDEILVERANDVIPYVRENLSAANRDEGFYDDEIQPDHCPSCGSDLVISGVNLCCPNPECRDRVLQSILFWVRQADIGQVALRSLEALYDAGKLRSVRDLYTFQAEDFDDLEGFGDKKIANFLDQVALAKSMTAVELISRLGIPMVQKKALSRLGIVSLQDFLDFQDDDYVIGRRIVEWKNEPGNMDFLHTLLEVVDIHEGQKNEDRRGVICLTGKAPMNRKSLIAALEERGWTVAGAVTRDTVKLVCDDTSGYSSKLKKARETGIDIVTYDDFLAEEDIAVV